MDTVSNPKESGQEENPIVALLDKHTRMLVRIGAALKKISERLDALEAEEEIADEPTFDESPALALLCDGRIAIHAIELGDIDLGNRARWEGVILNESEASDALEHLEDAFSASAALVGGELIARVKRAASKRNDEPGEGEES